MNRVTRRIAAWIAVAAVAFAQLAVSAYACPMESGAVALDTPCEEMVVNANLCEGHCNYGSSVVQHQGIDLVPAFVPIALPTEIFIAHSAERPSFVRERSHDPAHSPPPLTLSQALRI